MSNQALLSNELNQFEEFLGGSLEKYASDSSTLLKAMKYSLSSGGKRFRPLLVIAAVKFGKGSLQQAFPVAAALEWIHTYSLIHDDLPAMDNDDFRRGNPTTHKKFSEAIAILAGDALLTSAFTMLLDQEDLSLSKRVQLAKGLSEAAGSNGMVAGQMEDIEGESQELTIDQLEYIHKRKTGALIEYAISAGCLLADIPVNASVALLKYAEHLGLAYQIHNDLKDVVLNLDQSGKESKRDEELGKNTYPSLLGVEPAMENLKQEIELATEQIELIKNSIDVSKVDIDTLGVFIQLLDYVKINVGA